MFGENVSFYNETIRKNIVAFGTLFNQITILRKDSNDNITNRIKNEVM